MCLFGLCQRKHLIEVNGELALVDELRQLAQLLSIRAEVKDLRINVPGGFHLLQVHNRDEPPTCAHDLETSCGCLSPHAVQNGIDALGMPRVDGICKICLGIINEFGGAELLQIRMVLAPGRDQHLRSHLRRQLDSKRAGASSRPGNQERFSRTNCNRS